MAVVELIKCDEMGHNEIRRFEFDDRPPIARYNLAGEYFATGDTCAHGEASLAEGNIDGGEVYCPFHMGAFDIRSGEATVAPCAHALNTYPVRIRDNRIFVEFDS